MTDCQHPKCAESDQPSAAHGDTSLCGLHLRGLQADIDDIARVLELIATQHDDLAQPAGSSDGVRSVPQSKPPMRLAVVDVMTGATAEAICNWAADVVSTSRALSVFEAGRILARNTETMFRHLAVADLALELREAATACRAVLPDDRWNTQEQDLAPRRVRRCSDPTVDGAPCGGDMRWRAGTLVIVCNRCGASEEIDGYAKIGTVCAAFNVPRSTLYRWVALGWVDKIGRDVCIDDVRAVVRRRVGIDDDPAVGHTV